MIRLLHVTDGYGDHKFYLNGRRITKTTFDEYFIKNKEISRKSMRKNSAWYDYYYFQ